MVVNGGQINALWRMVNQFSSEFGDEIRRGAGDVKPEVVMVETPLPITRWSASKSSSISVCPDFSLWNHKSNHRSQFTLHGSVVFSFHCQRRRKDWLGLTRLELVADVNSRTTLVSIKLHGYLTENSQPCDSVDARIHSSQYQNNDSSFQNPKNGISDIYISNIFVEIGLKIIHSIFIKERKQIRILYHSTKPTIFTNHPSWNTKHWFPSIQQIQLKSHW